MRFLGINFGGIFQENEKKKSYFNYALASSEKKNIHVTVSLHGGSVYFCCGDVKLFRLQFKLRSYIY